MLLQCFNVKMPVISLFLTTETVRTLRKTGREFFYLDKRLGKNKNKSKDFTPYFPLCSHYLCG